MKTYILLLCIIKGIALLASFPLNGRDDDTWKDGMSKHHGKSVTDEIIDINAKLKLSDIEQFDIKMVEATEQPIIIATNDHHRNKRATFTNNINKWSNGIIPYEIRSDIEGSASHVAAINEAIEEIHQKTKCIKFIRKTSETQKHILFHIGNGCWSYVGNVTAFPTSQLLSIGYGCDVKGIVLHEIKHALGWYHEHARTDRDDYINVNYENILQENWKFFDKRNDIFGNTGRYDVDSIMHYSRYAFSKSYNLQSISWKGNQEQMVGQRYSLSDGDVKQLDEIYCGTHAATTDLPSKATTMPTTTTTTPTTPSKATTMPTTTTTTPTTTAPTPSKATTMPTTTTTTPTTTKPTTYIPTTTESIIKKTTTPKTTTSTTSESTTTTTTTTTTNTPTPTTTSKTTTTTTPTTTTSTPTTTTTIVQTTTTSTTTTPTTTRTTNEQTEPTTILATTLNVKTTLKAKDLEALIETAFCIAINAKLLCEYEYLKSYLQTHCAASCL